MRTPDPVDPHQAATVNRRGVLALGAVAAGGFAAARASAAPLSGDIVSMSAVDLTESIRTRRLSCVELMNASLDRIAAVNPKVNAIVALHDRERLLAEARAADAKVASGAPLGPLHGLPHAVKDLTAVAGLPSTKGSPIFRNDVPRADAPPVVRLREAGAIIIGKTNTPEFGLGSHTFNAVYGATRNPYAPQLSAGGSSGGAAVAVALDMTPLADGSDFGGSLRNPAGWNNVYGFRTSPGRVPLVGADPWVTTMAVQGPMARNVADLSLLLSVQAGYDARAPFSMESSGQQFRTVSPRPVQGKRIAWSADMKGAVPYEPGVLEVCGEALKTFETLGCTVEEASPDYPVERVWEAFVKLRNWDTCGRLVDYYQDPARRPLLKPEAVYEIEAGLGLSASDITAYKTVRAEWTQAVRAFLERYDYWIMPTAQVFPFPVDLRWPTEVAGRPMRTYHEWMMGVCLVTMAGCPALAAPAGFSPGGLPMGIQIIAPVHHEHDCLHLALAYEAAADSRLARRPQIA